MRYFNLFKRAQFLLSSLFIFVITLILGFSFCTVINRSQDVISTFNNCEANYIGYSTKLLKEDTYFYYKNKLMFNIKKEKEGIVLNADYYQFIDDVKYTNKSIINPKNIVNGEYSVLNDKEIALPITLTEKYGFSLGSKVYLNGETEYTIKYIYKNVLNIKEPLLDSDANAVFVGKSDKLLNKNVIHATFDNETERYNLSSYIFNDYLDVIRSNIYMYLGIIAGIEILLFLPLIFIYHKEEYKNLKNNMYAGNKKAYFIDLIAIGMFTLLIPSSIALLITGFFINTFQLFIMGIIPITLYLLNVLVLRIRTL